MEKDENQNDLEYNDGLGDLLREKEKLEFSWGKTTAVLVVVIVLIFLGLTYLFNVGKNIVTETGTTTPELQNTLPIEEKNDELVALLNKNTGTSETEMDEDDAEEEDIRSAEQPEIQETLQALEEKPAQSVATDATSPYKFKVIAGTYKSKGNATNMVNTLKSKQIDAFVSSYKSGDVTLYRVQAGAYKTRDAARTQKLMLSKHQIDSYILASE